MRPGVYRSRARRFASAAGVLLLVAAGAAAAPRLAELPQAWRNDEGKRVALSDHLGRRVVLTMAYASCHRICPATMTELEQYQGALDARGEAADFVIVGYDPAHDDAAAWRRFRARHHLTRANWSFLGGSRRDTEALARALGFEYWTYDEHVMHGARVVVFDTHGLVMATADPATPGWAAAL